MLINIMHLNTCRYDRSHMNNLQIPNSIIVYIVYTYNMNINCYYNSLKSLHYIRLYQIKCTIYFQAFCSTISNILATNAILKGVGVGDAQATALAATVTYILKDGAGMVGRITFAWWKG